MFVKQKKIDVLKNSDTYVTAQEIKNHLSENGYTLNEKLIQVNDSDAYGLIEVREGSLIGYIQYSLSIHPLIDTLRAIQVRNTNTVPGQVEHVFFLNGTGVLAYSYGSPSPADEPPVWLDRVASLIDRAYDAKMQRAPVPDISGISSFFNVSLQKKFGHRYP